MMTADLLKTELDAYLQRIRRIRQLSVAHPSGVGTGEGYSRDLKLKSKEIGTLANENKRMLKNVLYPLLESTTLLNTDIQEVLGEFSDYLLKPWPQEELDLSLLYLVSEKLYKDAVRKKDDYLIIRWGRVYIYACYNNMTRANRVATNRNIIEFYQRNGLRAARRLLSYLDKDRFLALKKNESRSKVLIIANFYTALYDSFFMTGEKVNEERLSAMENFLVMADDPFYRDAVPGFNWNRQKIRCLENIGQLTENGNAWCMTKEQCNRIARHMDELVDLWSEDPVGNEEHLPRFHMELLQLRNYYFSGRLWAENYRKALVDIYTKWGDTKYDMYSVMANVLVPTEYLSTVKAEDTNEELLEQLREFYSQICNYIMQSNGDEAYSFMLDYLCMFLNAFIQIPGEFDFEQMGLRCIAALHPPTYVHSMQVAVLSRCICEHMIRRSPELFIGICGCSNVREVAINEEQILSHIYHAAICHDFGKISVLDTIATYGRDLVEQEKILLREHAGMGSMWLAKYSSTRDYADIALKHHIWHDGKKGYPILPEDEDNGNILTKIVTVADCLDASTDRIGRSYKRTHTTDALIADLKKGSGNHYMSEVVSILELAEVREDVDFLLQRGREDHYRNAYLLLRTMQENVMQDFDSRLKDVVLRTVRIRQLSSPQIDEVGVASGYGELLSQHFKEIGMLAGENRKILELTLYPMLEDERSFDPETAESLRLFCNELLNGQDLSDYDQSLVYLISKRLLKDAREKQETDNLVKQLDIHISSCYEMMHQAKRMKTAEALIKRYREEGLDAAREIWSYLDKEKFVLLDMESRELVLINSRYAVFMYETELTPEANEIFISRLKDAFYLSKDRFYREHAPEYDWDYHQLRSLEYIGQATECGNPRGITKEQCLEIVNLLEELRAIWGQNPEKNSKTLPEASVRLLLIRNRYRAGLVSLTEYRKELLYIFYTWRRFDYDFDSVIPNIQVPAEYVISFEGQDKLSENDIKNLDSVYQWVIAYVFKASNAGAYSLMLEYFSELIYHFVEIPGKTDMLKMGLYSMAAIHPPTYVHSMLVGKLSLCLCKHMLRLKPEAFIGVCDTQKVSDVEWKEAQIQKFCYNAAICHDFGKIPMIDTIFVYGRKLLDHEFELLKHHPGVGAMLLESHASTRDYADIAKGHHKWYDNSRGYPEDFDTSSSPYKTIIDIVAAADCLDAATDTVGRSYAVGKRPSEIIREIQDGAGTRYSPVIAECLNDEKLRLELVHILEQVRRENYENTFYLLQDMLDNGRNDYADVKQEDKETDHLLAALDKMLTEEERYLHAYKIVSFDRQTICPEEGIEDAGEAATALSGAAYRVRKRDEFIQTVGKLYLKCPQLDDADGVLVRRLYKEYLRDRNITAEEMEKYDTANKAAWNDWIKARKENDFTVMADALDHRIHLDIERVSRWEAEAFPAAKCIYDRMLDEYETGMTTEILDKLFDECRERIFPIMEKLREREALVRTDFLNIRVTDEQQMEITEYLMDLLEFDRSRGAWSLTTHPFTERIGRNDTRITTHFEPDNFLSNIYTVIHECGHALFEQLQPSEDYRHHIEDFKTMGQHESVSRFYENIIGRSESFIHLIYPKICEVFPEAMQDVGEEELYAAVNHVQPSLIRTDADELTYTLHIMIRYELEREMAAGRLNVSELREKWAGKYERYLGIRPADDLTGILQDVHWTDCLGYFPTYALGNFYGGMYLSRMQKDFDPFESLSEHGFSRINRWMEEHVFAKANRLEPAAWIKDITGRELNAEDYLDYLERKYLEQ